MCVPVYVGTYVCMYLCVCGHVCMYVGMCVVYVCVCVCVCTCRCHIVEEFNRGVYDYIIATDEAPEIDVVGGQRRRGQKRRKDKEYGVVRGIDFQGMAGCL